MQTTPVPPVLLLLLLPVGAPFWTSQQNKMEKTTDYDLYYVGENLSLYCHKASDFVGDISFRMGNLDVPSQFVRKLNNTWAMMEKPVTSQDFPETVYQCTDNDTAPWVATLRLYHDYPPRAATDLNVVWQEKRELLINWAFGGTTYKNTHPFVIQITAEWSQDLGSDKVWQECTVTDNSCVVSDSVVTPDTLFVRVNVTMVKRHNDRVSTVFPAVTVDEHAKPGPVQFEVEAVNSNSAKVTLRTNEILKYSITYTATGDKQNHNGTVMTPLTEEKTLMVDGLRPAYSYRFEVEARYAQGYPSEASVSTQTLLMPDVDETSAGLSALSTPALSALSTVVCLALMSVTASSALSSTV